MRKECGCGLATMSLEAGLNIISDHIIKIETDGKPLEPMVIGMLNGYAKSIYKDIAPEIRNFCDIDTKHEEKSLRNIMDNIKKINQSGPRDLVHNNIVTIRESLTDKLKECKENK